jgi:Predicted nucleic acid-binding protein, contains PIN domain
MIILDTDVMVDILRGYPPAVSWLESLGEQELGLPGFVVMELIRGCRNRREQRLLENALAEYTILWPTRRDCDAALQVFSEFIFGVAAVLWGYMLTDATNKSLKLCWMRTVLL